VNRTNVSIAIVGFGRAARCDKPSDPDAVRNVGAGGDRRPVRRRRSLTAALDVARGRGAVGPLSRPVRDPILETRAVEPRGRDNRKVGIIVVKFIPWCKRAAGTGDCCR
jgi:hypothetical protein